MSKHIKMTKLTYGLTLYPDGGFSCLSENHPVKVKVDHGGVYVKCRDGNHYLDGQEDGKGNCVGLSRDRWPL